MKDRPGAHDLLGPADEVLDLKKVAVTQDRLKRGDLGVGALHEDPVLARLLGELAHVDLELGGAPGSDLARIAPLAEVSRFVAWRAILSLA